MDYSWPGNVRELHNLVESMVVLSPGHEIGPEDIPREIRDARARFLPVPVGAPVRGRDGAGIGVEGREFEFIVRSLVELKSNVEELRRRTEQLAASAAGRGVGMGVGGGVGVGLGGDGMEGDVSPLVSPGAPRAALGAGSGGGVGASRLVNGAILSGIEPPGAPPPPNIVTVRPGMTMAEIERASIEAALRETRGNRRKAAEMLGIGERRFIGSFESTRFRMSPLRSAGRSGA